MPRIQYAFRDDEKTISLLVQGSTAACPLCQIITLRKREIAPEFLDQFTALDIKGTAYPATALTELGRSTEPSEAFRSCLLKVHSQIEFTVKPRLMQRLTEFMPAYNATGLYNFFGGQPYGFIAVLQVFESTTVIPDALMEKGRMGSAQIIQLYDQNGQKTFFDVPEPVNPLIDEGTFEYIRDEIIHALRVENALIGVYESDEDSKRLLRQKRDAYNNSTGQFKHTYDEDDDIDRSITDYDEIYRRIIEKDPSLGNFVAYVQTIKPPQMVEWQTLLPKALAGNTTARMRIVEMYTRNVLRIALYYSEKYELPIADIIQDGLVGLITSIDKFDQAESSTFQTYYPMWVRQMIQREMPHYMYARYFPVHIHEKLMAVREIAAQTGVDLPPDRVACEVLIPRICEEFDFPEDRARQLLKYFSTTESLDVIMEQQSESDENVGIMACFIADEDIMDAIVEKDCRKALLECLNTLTDREAEILSMRYGMHGGTPQTLEEVGKVFGVTRERIRQLENKAIRKLQHPSRAIKIKDYYSS